MEKQLLSVGDRLERWRAKFDARLGRRITDFAQSTAESCFLACATLPDLPCSPDFYPHPPESVVSITRIGSRSHSRPATARPAEYAAYIFKQVVGHESEAVHEYLEALLGPKAVLTKWEISQRLRRRHKDAKQIARIVTNSYTQRLSLDKLKQYYREAHDSFDKERNAVLPGMKQQLVASMEARMTLFPLIQERRLDHLDPIVTVSKRREAGKYSFGGSNYTLSERKVQFDLKKAHEQAPEGWAIILILPGWHAAWMGEVPLQTILNAGAMCPGV
jgi:hypothetical protein